MVCHNSPHGAGETHEIAEDGRRIDIKPLAVNWGNADLRVTWEGNYAFCSFKCLSDWAAGKAAEHDNHTLQEGSGA